MKEKETNLLNEEDVKRINRSVTSFRVIGQFLIIITLLFYILYVPYPPGFIAWYELITTVLFVILGSYIVLRAKRVSGFAKNLDEAIEANTKVFVAATIFFVLSVLGGVLDVVYGEYPSVLVPVLMGILMYQSHKTKGILNKAVF